MLSARRLLLFPVPGLLLLFSAPPGTVPAGYAEESHGTVRALVLGEGRARAAFVQEGAEGRVEVRDAPGPFLLRTGDPRTARAVVTADLARAPAVLRLGRVSLRGLVENRFDPGGAVEEAGLVLRVARAGGGDLAVVLFLPVRAEVRDAAPPGVPVLALPGACAGQALRPGAEAALTERVRAALASAEPLSGRFEVRRAECPVGNTFAGCGALRVFGAPAALSGAAGNEWRALVEREGTARFALVCRERPAVPSPEEWQAGFPGARGGPFMASDLAGFPPPGRPGGRGPDLREGPGDAGLEHLVDATRGVRRFFPRAALGALHENRPDFDAAFVSALADPGSPLRRTVRSAPLVEPVAPPAPATGVLVRRVWFDSPLPSGDPRNDRFSVEEHVPPGTARGAVVVLPIWKGGILLPERLVAAHLAARGYLAAVVPLPWQMRRSPPGIPSGDRTVSSDLPRTRRALLQAKEDVRAVTDRLVALPEVRRGRVGVLGVSLGAHVAAVAYRDDPRFSAGVFVMAGGDPATLVWAGSSETRRMKEEIVAQGLGLADLREFFAPLDPAAFPQAPAWPGFARRNGILMVNATRDRVVPRENAMLLHRAFGEPTLVWVEADHYSIAGKMPEVFAAVDRHLDAIFR